ncbi:MULTISPECIES: efflux RND transporter periplasmic adaptor subunit [unclassified Lysobacter]|uniref:efflux RND transporter periplasmic adaptor subunit n=1 Tax=unclassified Lysobacter TaxID=2635362 RepID=UPI001BEBC219|nr:MULTISPECIES: efflux RND transporter periplasmic adaptor subunit [unclassified Lysobacter]MBT2746011.1 efflux RND transporter periplasmic adaptor subunit [Lysobacter sp. ISL-42]MBT2752446.1 efflux RND transporter periplasmic adaptor subunit [Lysobacter sp. ISL-50]MBT2776825.1 efflux RND transporter periplasmic adaptor subunit [Lysobacter sp. ISL-54]MBT2780607.1 efflux RND transporter periplasmic adaptor subunit [Lysobacter sp. ISL-52]
MNRSKPQAKPIRIALALAVSAALLAALSGCGRSSAESAPASTVPDVLTVQAKAADAAYDLSLPARAQAGESAQLYARATGFVSERKVELGDKVAAGQVLATISAPEIDQAVREARAVLAQTSADQELAKVNYDRAQTLIGTGAVSKEYFSDRKGNYDVAVAARNAAQARLTSALERQAFQSVRAPFAGVVVARNVERGDRVVGDSASSTVPMFEVAVLDPLRVVVDVPQNVSMQIENGLEAQVSFPELPGQTFKAQVARSARNLSRDAGVMRTELRLPNPDSRIPAGMVGSARLHLPRAAPAVVLPVSTVIQRGSGTQVVTLKTDSTLAYRDVTLGRNLGNEVEVLSGVSPGDTVVLAPNAMLADGNKVNAKALPPPKKF